MSSASILDHLFIGHAALSDRRDRGPAGLRLTIAPISDNGPVDAPALLQRLLEVFPGPALLLLNVQDSRWLDALLGQVTPAHLVAEVPAELAADAERANLLRRQRAAGCVYAFSGRPAGEIPAPVQGVFRYAVTPLGMDAGPADPSAGKGVTPIVTGVREGADFDKVLTHGALICAGWPVEGAVRPADKGQVPPDMRGIMELMTRVDRGEPAEKMEPVLKTDPTLAFRLLRYINSPAFGLRTEVTSFKHALMMLGYARLKRWLALLLASGSRDPLVRPLMRASVCRGFLMEALAKEQGEEQLGSDMFICGVFSLLDQMLRQPFKELLQSVPVPDAVASSLLYPDGPYSATLDLARAVERGNPEEMRELSARLSLRAGQLSSATLQALAAARQVE